MGSISVGSTNRLLEMKEELLLLGFEHDTQWEDWGQEKDAKFLRMYGNGKFAMFKDLYEYHKRDLVNIEDDYGFKTSLERHIQFTKDFKL